MLKRFHSRRGIQPDGTPLQESLQESFQEARDAATRERLDGLVVNMELTLISIIQGVALYFLTDTSRGLILEMRVDAWPYIVVGLMTIFLFWSRSLIHTFTVIRWPLEFGHNFLYIACTLAEAVMFTQIGNLQNWFLLGAIYGAMVWFLFAFDLGMIRRRRLECAGQEREELCAILERDQLLNVRLLMPGLVLYNLIALFTIHHHPDLFIGRSWHLLFGGMQIVGGALYLAYVLRFYRRIAPMIVGYRSDAERG